MDCGGTTPLLLRAWCCDTELSIHVTIIPCHSTSWPRLRLNSLRLSACVRCRKSGDMSPQSKAAPHLPSNALELLCVRTTSEMCVFPPFCAELTGVTAPFHARDENTLDCGGTTPLLFRAWLASAALEFSAAFALCTVQEKRGHVPAVQSRPASSQ